MTSTSVKNNFLPPSLVSNLQEVLISRKGGEEEQSNKTDEPTEASSSSSLGAFKANSEMDSSKPIVLLTNGDGIDSPGLSFLAEALVREGRCNIHVCAPQSDKSVSGHSMTIRETLAVSSAEISGATAYGVSGTPADCVSLALSGALFSWSKPALVISGINRGSSCGHHMFYSGAVAGAREALICGVPSLSISLNWKKDESRESDFEDAVNVCLPLIDAAIRDIEKGVFPRSCSLNIEIPTSPLTNKFIVSSSRPEYRISITWLSLMKSIDFPLCCIFGPSSGYRLAFQIKPLELLFYQFAQKLDMRGSKVTRQSLWRCTPSWQAVSANRHPSAGHFMSNQQSLGIQLAQLSRDASAAGAARRLNTQRKNVEIESVGVAGKVDSQRAVKKFFRLEFMDKEKEDMDEDLDFRALENGFVAITPLSLSSHVELETQTSASEWVATALTEEQ
ncbi:hypothetical protein HHK36_014318 [Tetracentron sinense]|uniref:Survival protein SurE-like phosphatase/nucleotidase domain-containing protein n=1 Tax=Tetracentron sinense TaxID=13715 RepID=A0A834Z5V7_TETSI|nr:hypothetical protein HHK36_014318 [Tetracentron sinense]